MSIYTDEGFRNRRDYLESLCEDFNVDLETVLTVAAILGPSEDFDGLITALEDIEAGF